MNDLDEGADDTPIFREFSDPRLVAVYDTVNPIAEYEKFDMDLAAKLSASTIVDIGCGTGLLTCGLAKCGQRLIGVEPSNTMLEVARRRPCGDQVVWIEGDTLGFGEELVSHAELKFRTRAELGRSLSEAGFSVESVFGDWDGRPADAASRELIFVAAT